MVLYEKTFALNPKSVYWSSKNKLKPDQVYKNSNLKYFFDCDNCKHEFYSSLNNISNGKWCCYCSNPPKKLCNSEDCEECFNKSFASHPKNKFWSEKNDLIPRQIFKNSSKSFLFNCNICLHEFEIKLENISLKNHWCCYCSNQKLCNNKNCEDCFNKSFASHPKSKFWSLKNKLKPNQVFKQSNLKYIFDCDNCKHEFTNRPDNIYKNIWCIFCANQKLCNNEKCKYCFNKSFATHPKSKFWSSNNNLKPNQVFKHSSSKYCFDCNICNNEFNSSLNHVSNGKWCPKCKHKTELVLFNWLKDNNYNSEKEVVFDWCKINKSYLRYDFVIENLKLIIELDGPQHFKQISNWQCPKKTKEKDKLKNILAFENGYRIIRIYQEIVLNNKEEWQIKLKNAIEDKKYIIEIGYIYIS